MDNIAKLVEELGNLTQQRKELYTQFSAIKETEDALRDELMIMLHESGLLTAKTPLFTASVVKRPNIFIADEIQVKEWLEHAPNIEVDQYFGIKATPLKQLALYMLKSTGEVMPGTELQESQSLSIKSNSKKENVGNENNQ